MFEDSNLFVGLDDVDDNKRIEAVDQLRKSVRQSEGELPVHNLTQLFQMLSDRVVDNNIDVGIIFETGSFDGVDTTARGMALYFDNSRNRLAVGKHINNVDFTASFDGGQSAFNVGQKGFRAGNMVTVKSTFIEGKNLSTEIGNDTKSASFGTGEIIIDTNEDIWFYVGADHDDEFPGD